MCCKSSTKFYAHKDTLEVVQKDIKQRLDLLVLLRRLRAYGACLTFLLNAKTRQSCIEITEKISIQNIESMQKEQAKSKWN